MSANYMVLKSCEVFKKAEAVTMKPETMKYWVGGQ